jgi:hypothetical protein
MRLPSVMGGACARLAATSLWLTRVGGRRILARRDCERFEGAASEYFVKSATARTSPENAMAHWRLALQARNRSTRGCRPISSYDAKPNRS